MDEQETISCKDYLKHQSTHELRRQQIRSHCVLPEHARKPLPRIVILLLAMVAWISTLEQTLSMSSTPSMIGPMGMSLGLFLLFWTIMMIAMMFPALVSTVSIHFDTLCQHTSNAITCIALLLFLVGYTLIWTLFGLPAFLLSVLDEYLFLHAPTLGIGLDIALLVSIGLYQMTPWAKRCLSYCNPTLGCHSEMSLPHNSFSYLKTGLIHGLYCLGTCGFLMLIMVVVGFMNLPWMILLTLIIFVEKTWSSGDRLCFLLGAGLILVAMMVFIDPAVLSSFSL